jgi:hypothetical protein
LEEEDRVLDVRRAVPRQVSEGARTGGVGEGREDEKERGTEEGERGETEGTGAALKAVHCVAPIGKPKGRGSGRRAEGLQILYPSSSLPSSGSSVSKVSHPSTGGGRR